MRPWAPPSRRGAPVLDALRGIVGAEAVRTGSAAARWAVHGRVPGAVVAPCTTGEAAAVLALASHAGWAVEPAGGGTWLDSGRPPARLDIVLTAERLTEIEAYEPADLTISAGAGLPIEALQARVGEHGQWLALDPARKPGATIGGLVATGSAGPQRLAYGTPRDQVLGLELVTGNGHVLTMGGRVVKNVAGYDLVRLVIGSRGTLGLITALHLRLRPLPKRDETWVIEATEPGPLIDVVDAVRDARIEPTALELLSPTPRDAAGWTLFARLQGSDDAVADAATRLTRAASPLAARRLDGAEAESAWSALNEREAAAALAPRLADRPANLRDTLELARTLPGAVTRWPLAAHAGDGIVRGLVPSDACGDAMRPDWARALSEARAALAERRGTLILACGPARLLGDVDPIGAEGISLELMRGLRETFDPAGVLAPGRFIQ